MIASGLYLVLLRHCLLKGVDFLEQCYWDYNEAIFRAVASSARERVA